MSFLFRKVEDVTTISTVSHFGEHKRLHLESSKHNYYIISLRAILKVIFTHLQNEAKFGEMVTLENSYGEKASGKWSKIDPATSVICFGQDYWENTKNLEIWPFLRTHW